MTLSEGEAMQAEELEQRRALSQEMHLASFSARTFDAGGALSALRLAEIRATLAALGAVHVQNTGLSSLAAGVAALPGLGWAADEQFSAGGRTSHAWQPKWVASGLRRLDYYPPDLYLLPNNEVQYQRFGPERVLFFCLRAPPVGGRTFLHSALAVEHGLRQHALGRDLLARMDAHGLMIETGFLDARHPRKADNYFQSWQERFGTDDPEQALARAQAQRDQYDHCWLRHDETGAGTLTLMTRITLSAFKNDRRDGGRYLRFPRLALGAPALENGYRRYPLGDGSELSAGERALLLSVYLDTREGTALRDGDLVLFDNVRYGHSRESFSGEREVYVGMAGAVWDDAAPEAAQPSSAALPVPAVPRRTGLAAGERYTLPDSATLWAARHSMRTFDAEGELSPARASAVRAELVRHGAVLVRRTGLRCASAADLPDAVLEGLGFGGAAEFQWGGLRSGRTARRSINRSLRATDDYPRERWLLPHNEILYQRQMPARLLFFSAQAADPACGGRTFVHDARQTEHWLRRQGAVGEALLADLRAHGFLIEMGFLDERHPRKAENYFRSWQDRFQTEDREVALARCLASRDQFDTAWWRPEDDGSDTWTLMTRITIPAFKCDPVTGQDCLLFPRIALDGPALHNGYRRFPLGSGRELSDAEVDLLLEAFLATREGLHYAAGDILLVDNIRYGHSREAFAGERELGVAMAGAFWTDDAAALGLLP